MRQLGMAHHVYPGAVHDRLEHSRGVVEVADRMLSALQRNADFQRDFGKAADADIPKPSEMDVASVRLGALLHDIGHGPFSHASEHLIKIRFADEFDRAENVLREEFAGVTRIPSSEVISAILVLSIPMARVFEHPQFTAVKDDRINLSAAIVGRILGSRSFLHATYLSGIVSGPLDADKLDYMARDSHHSGLPLGLDLKRLISKLEVVTVTPDNAPNDEMKRRAEEVHGRRYYEIGISLSGLGAYEQLIVARVILYDRLYYHHKVRAAEAMVRRLIELAEEERSAVYTLEDLFISLSDDTMIGLLGGHLTHDSFNSGQERTNALATDILERRIYYRAFAFAARFIEGLEGLPRQEESDTKALLWGPVIECLDEPEGASKLACKIHDKAVMIASKFEKFGAVRGVIKQEHILVDLPLNRVVVRGSDILTRTEDGQVGTPNLFFDPERWSQAYEHQKQCGFVYTRPELVELVAYAARIVFFEEFQLGMGAGANRASKTGRRIAPTFFSDIASAGLCSAECAEALRHTRIQMAPLRGDDIKTVLPERWQIAYPAFGTRLSREITDVLPAGLPASIHGAFCRTLGHLISFLDTTEQGGTFVSLSDLSEKKLQIKIRDHIRARGGKAQEGSEVGGGETDLLVEDWIVVENKCVDRVKKPFDKGKHYAWQARRYSIAVCSRISVVALGYKPSDESAILELPERIKIMTPDNEEISGIAQVRVVIPWGQSVPSDAKAP